MSTQEQPLLLLLPAELQLAIFEYAVREEEPLLLNCACVSSYDRDYVRWEEGKLHAPEQPALTKTCSTIRDIALPMYYKLNLFRAHYCYEIDMDSAVAWLDRIGPVNRIMMRDIAFWDLNRRFDKTIPGDLLQLKRSKANSARK